VTDAAAADDDPRAFPGAHAPDRRRVVDSSGLAISVYEWGDEAAVPLLLAHGGMDFARTYDVFAPMLAAGGYRVVAWDQRGHGDSEHANLYNWSADTRDALAVLDSVTHEPCRVVGHSKGAGLMMELADALPHRVSHLVNMDGLPSSRNMPDVSDRERTRMRHAEIMGWLDHRAAAATKVRRPGTLDELAERRGRMNTRLSKAWLRYLVTVGAEESADGWRWKLDPALRFGGFGPWNPEWSMGRLPGLSVPVLGILALQPDALGWGTQPEDVEGYFPLGARLVALEDAGHFVHIEQPERVADLVLEFLS
jgi:pimeloyl-ACP methyl ester carboxylesterase